MDSKKYPNLSSILAASGEFLETYKGYQYTPEKDQEEDVVKIFHTVKAPDGSSISIDWSPYEYISENDFKLWIDKGMPKRTGKGPLTHDDLAKI
jgi:hypothetical protein